MFRVFSFKNFLTLFLISFLGSLVFGFSNAEAVVKTTKPKYERLFYYQGGKLAKQSFMKNYKSIDVFAPQTYHFDENGELKGSLDEELIKFAKSKKIKIIPLVTNNGFSLKASQSLLGNKKNQDKAINALVKEAEKYGYYGWQIDFEQMDISLRDSFTSFIKNAGEKMRENDLSLSVAVMAHISDNPDDYPKDLWRRILGVYDYTALASNVDFVSIMSYDDPESKGPVARYSWLLKVIDYSIAHIPKEKISLGIPLYYWQWKDSTGKLVGIGGNEGIQNVLEKHKAQIHYSSAEQAPHIHYWNKSISYTLWYENAQSVKKKISLITQNGLHGFSAWALGLELASVYTAMGK